MSHRCGAEEPAAALIPAMLTAFLVADRAFVRRAKQRGGS